MSRRSLFFKIAAPWITRGYVGTKEEVRAYQEAKQRALGWVMGNRQRKVNPTAAAIDVALCQHLFDPLTRIPSPPALPMLSSRNSFIGLDTCEQMLRDLEPYLSARNVVRCCERTAHILAYSEEEIWFERHRSCLLHLCEMIQLAMPRCSRAELGILVWSFGKWGPKALSLKPPDDDASVGDVVARIMERLCEVGVKGELDNVTISNVLNGCRQLRIQPNGRLLRSMSDHLLGSIEFADAHLLTRLILSIAQLKLKLSTVLLVKIAAVLETKCKAGTYPEKELAVMIWSLGQWKKGGCQELMPLCQRIERRRLQWGFERWTLQQRLHLLEGFFHLRYFPSWRMLEQNHYAVKKHHPSESVSQRISFLRVFAEMGVRPEVILQSCASMLENLEDQKGGFHVSHVCCLLRSFSLLSVLTVHQFTNGVRFVRVHAMDMTTEDKEALYLSFLDRRYGTSDPSDSEQISQPMDAFLKDSCQDVWRQNEKQRQLQDLATLPEHNKHCIHCLDIADGDISILSAESDTQQNTALCLNPDTFLNTGRFTGSQLWRLRLLQQLGWTFNHHHKSFKRTQ